MLVSRDNYLLKEIPKFNPHSIEYLDFWKEQKFKVIHGMWSGGYWIPGILYHYVNFWTIEIKETSESKTGKIGRPFFRDVDYDFCLAYAEARGFSRFEKQLKEDVAGMKPRDIMTSFYGQDMGRPLFENPAKNIALVTGRRLGKSYLASNACGYEFLHEKKGEKKEVVVGAGDSKYSTDLLKKVKLGIDNLPGAEEHNGVYYPPPFSKKYKGSLQCGKSIVANYDVYIGNSRVTKGNGSSIKHVSYSDNTFAAQGTGAVLQIYEEGGEFVGLIDTWNNNKETVMNGMQQFGTQFVLGTGGNMSSGTVDLSRIFFDTETFNLVEFEDTWEQKGSIGMFFPAYRGLNEFKDDNGNTIEKEAIEKLVSIRKKLKDNNAPRAVIEKEFQYRPLKPSEAFLISSGNIFPQAELQDQLSLLENDPDYTNFASVGRLEFNKDGDVYFEPDSKLQEITRYPLEHYEDTEGAVVIWEHPRPDPPRGMYILSADPYDHDKSQTGSLGSLFVYKRFVDFENSYDFFVAEYTARPRTADEWYENCRKLCLYYNGRLLYENERKGIHQYFKQKGSSYLLVDQPDDVIKDIIKNSTVDREKGIHMTRQIKDYGERLLNSWLLEEYAEGKKNVSRIYSRALIKELLMYDGIRNTDRVIAAMVAMIMLQQMHKYHVKQNEEDSLKKFFDVELFDRSNQKY